jgi:hypothetical protein
MGVIIGPPETYFGLQEWGSRGTKEIKQNQYDIVIYEIRKMFSLLLQGNPNVLSMLWCRPEHYLISTEIGKAIIAARELFVGKHVYNAFAGYAYAQLEKMETRDPAELRKYMAITAELKCRGEHPNHKGEIFPAPDQSNNEAKDASFWSTDRLIAGLKHYHKKGENLGYLGEKRKQLILEFGFDLKNGAHLIRLLKMCIEFMKTGELEVYRSDASELLDIKRGKWPLERIKSYATELFAEARAAKEASTLPAEPRRAEVEALLVQLTKKHLLG